MLERPLQEPIRVLVHNMARANHVLQSVMHGQTRHPKHETTNPPNATYLAIPATHERTVTAIRTRTVRLPRTPVLRTSGRLVVEENGSCPR